MRAPAARLPPEHEFAASADESRADTPPLACPATTTAPPQEYASILQRRAAGRPVSHRHSALIRTIFQDPINTNIHWREVESLLRHLGADIEALSGNRIHLRLNRADGVLHRPHHAHTLDRNAIRTLRGYLASAGITPALYEARENNPPDKPAP